MEEVNYGSDFKWNKDDNDSYKSDTTKTYTKRVYQPSRDIIKDIYTDGGSRKINNEFWLGAWSFYDSDTNEVHGCAEYGATNNQMELTAVIRALEYCNELGVSKEGLIRINLDSEYVKNGFVKNKYGEPYVDKWVKNNWVRMIVKPDGTKEPAELKNVDLWKRLYELVQERGRSNIWWNHVPGHSGVEGNERVDINCRLLMDNYLKDNNISVKK